MESLRDSNEQCTYEIDINCLLAGRFMFIRTNRAKARERGNAERFRVCTARKCALQGSVHVRNRRKSACWQAGLRLLARIGRKPANEKTRSVLECALGGSVRCKEVCMYEIDVNLPAGRQDYVYWHE